MLITENMTCQVLIEHPKKKKVLIEGLITILVLYRLIIDYKLLVKTQEPLAQLTLVICNWNVHYLNLIFLIVNIELYFIFK